MRLHRALIALISTALCAQDTRDKAIAALASLKFDEGIALFKQAVADHPNEVRSHLDLGSAYLTIGIPGAAETEFRRALELDSDNTMALASMANISYGQALPLTGEEKLRKYDEARDWNKRLAAADPTNKAAPYAIALIAWMKYRPAVIAARTAHNMKPEDRTPLPSPVRQELKAQYSAVLEEGISSLDQALRIDPHYSEAMLEMYRLIRERADLRDTKEEYEADVAIADEWMRKAFAAKEAQAQSGVAPTSRVPPTAGERGGRTPAPPSRVRVGGNVMAANIIRKVAPTYPPDAKKAHVSGQVRFTVIVGKDGTIKNIQLVSGDPLLVDAARDAVQQWVYKPTLLDGNPVEVITQIDVNFNLRN
jgi:TonB family protein